MRAIVFLTDAGYSPHQYLSCIVHPYKSHYPISEYTRDMHVNKCTEGTIFISLKD